MAADPTEKGRAAHRHRLRQRLLSSVRVRTTAAATLAVGIAMVIGSVVMVGFIRDSTRSELEIAARLRADEVATGITVGAGQRTFGDEDSLLVQFLDADGRVTGSSANVVGKPALARPAPDEAVEVHAAVGRGTFLAVSTEVGTGTNRPAVLVALSTEPVDDSTGVALRLVMFGLPVLLLIVAVTTWLVVGRALAPVEAIRREVAEISGSQMHRRVPDPASDDEIARLARTMNGMLGRLERSRERQQRFVSDASHELRSPIASIRQNAEVALAHPERSSLAELATTVLAEDLRIQRLVSDLLALASADERSLVGRRRPVDLDDLVFEVAGDLKAVSGLRVDTRAVSPAPVSGDAGGLRRMLVNVAENAARHARERISFALAESGGTVLLAVDDDGPGIPAAARERVLERFVRLDNARARDGGGSGSGLGLAIVAELVAAHGGTVVITTSSLGGARVELRMPALRDPLTNP